MALHWVICGSGRGVGKTRLTRRLCGLLPRATYAKLGHHPPKPDGPPHYFRDPAALDDFVSAHDRRCAHILIECNAWALEGRGDLIVYLEGRPADGRIRDDAGRLRDRAHLRIGPGYSRAGWQEVLRPRLPDRALREAVCRALSEQARYLLRTAPGGTSP